MLRKVNQVADKKKRKSSYRYKKYYGPFGWYARRPFKWEYKGSENMEGVVSSFMKTYDMFSAFQEVSFLKEMNLVQPKVLKRVGKKRLIWEARRAKKPGAKEVNLVKSKRNEESEYLKRMAKRVKKDYLEAGYEVIGWRAPGQ